MVLLQLIGVFRFTVGLQIVGRGADYPVGVHQPSGNQRRIGQISGADRQVETFIKNIHHPVCHPKLNFNARVLFAKFD